MIVPKYRLVVVVGQHLTPHGHLAGVIRDEHYMQRGSRPRRCLSHIPEQTQDVLLAVVRRVNAVSPIRNLNDRVRQRETGLEERHSGSPRGVEKTFVSVNQDRHVVSKVSLWRMLFTQRQ